MPKLSDLGVTACESQRARARRGRYHPFSSGIANVRSAFRYVSNWQRGQRIMGWCSG